MSVPVRLRQANKGDLQFVMGLLKANNLCFEDVPAKLSSLFLAYANSTVVGVGGVEVFGEVGLLRSVAIKEQHRGKGLGKSMVSEIIDRAKAKGVKDLYLLTTTAESFFAQMGFRTIKRDSAPKAIRETTEFKVLCADTSTLMLRKIA